MQAKDKEQAVLHLYRIYNLHPVNHGPSANLSRIFILDDNFYFKASLRPPAENQTMQTNGRKSGKKAKKIKDAAAATLLKGDEDGGVPANEDSQVDIELDVDEVAVEIQKKKRKSAKKHEAKHKGDARGSK